MHHITLRGLRSAQKLRSCRQVSQQVPKYEVDPKNMKSPPKFAKILERMELFQRDDGVLIHLKGGLKDQFLYKITFALVLAGNVYGLSHIPEMIS